MSLNTPDVRSLCARFDFPYDQIDRWPHLLRAFELVDAMEQSVFPPWRWPRWFRCYRAWKRVTALHRAAMREAGR